MQQAFLYLRMRYALLISVAFIYVSFKTFTDFEKKHQRLEGNWLVVAPDHNLKNDRQEIIYSEIQDSIIELTALKLITFSENGVFRQIDSFDSHGKWGVSSDNVLFIENGGQGFNNFNGRIKSNENGLLELTELVNAEDEKIELIWKLKKVSDKFSSKLFDDDKNAWRRRPAHRETEAEIKLRLSKMLHYYSDYYLLVTEESSFFVTTRVMLPFKFYQHSMGIKPFDEHSYFATLFYDRSQAEQAWKYLSLVTSALRHNFPRREDFLLEYAAFMETMSEKIREL
jgi:hypothetical protein